MFFKPFLFLAGAVGIAAGVVSVEPRASSLSNAQPLAVTAPVLQSPPEAEMSQIPETPPIVVTHIALPAEVRGFYVTASTVSIARAATLFDDMKKRGANAFVLDVQDDHGMLAFSPTDATLTAYAESRPLMRHLDTLLADLGDAGWYRIARIVVMRNATLAEKNPASAIHRGDGALWHDRRGSPWMDPASPVVGDSVIAIAREMYARGFDEVQFDYVRFPTEGAGQIVFPVMKKEETRREVMGRFWKKVGGTLHDEHIPVSFDFFGTVFWSERDRETTGQYPADIFSYADFISPMVYPSHYAPGFLKYKNPALYPSEVVGESLARAPADFGVTADEAARKIRPWLQNFDLGAVYTAEKIEAQIKAARDNHSSGWLLWNARNVYRAAEYVSR